MIMDPHEVEIYFDLHIQVRTVLVINYIIENRWKAMQTIPIQTMSQKIFISGVWRDLQILRKEYLSTRIAIIGTTQSDQVIIKGDFT